jgi:hypothetical protein
MKRRGRWGLAVTRQRAGAWPKLHAWQWCAGQKVASQILLTVGCHIESGYANHGPAELKQVCVYANAAYQPGDARSAEWQNAVRMAHQRILHGIRPVRQHTPWLLHLVLWQKGVRYSVDRHIDYAVWHVGNLVCTYALGLHAI